MPATKFVVALALAMGLGLNAAAHAAYLVEIDTDGADDNAITYNPHFAFGGDTTTAAFGAASSAVGLTGGDSLFGGNGLNQVDTYLYFYTPGSDGDNLPLVAGTPLNNDGHTASGAVAGVTGQYRIFATWPTTNNVSGGLTRFTLKDNLGNTWFSLLIDQNTAQDNEQDGAGDEWIYIATATLNDALRYQLIQEAGINTFVSMRSAGVLFDRVIPEPATAALLALGSAALTLRRRARR